MHKLFIAAAASAGLLALGACAEPAPEQETTAEQTPSSTALPPEDTAMPPVEDPMMPADPNAPGTTSGTAPGATPPTLPEDQTSPPAQ